MGFSLKSFVRKGFDQVNPLDNGRSFQNQAPVVVPPRPATTSQNPIQHALGSVGNAISKIGAAPHPVNIMPVEAAQKIQNATKGILAQGNNAQRYTDGMTKLNTAMQPTVRKGLGNLGQAFNDSNAQAGRFVAREFATKPVMEGVQSVRQHVTHKPSSYTPGSAWEKQLFGDNRIDSLQKVHDDTGAQLRRSSNPILRNPAVASVLGNANTALHVANDVPVVGATTKVLAKGTKLVAPAVERAAVAAVPKAAPLIRNTSQAVQRGAQTVEKGLVATGKATGRQIRTSYDKKDSIANYDASIADVDKRIADLTKRQQGTTNFRGVETMQRHKDMLEAQKTQMIANKPKMTLKDRVLAPNIGLSSQPVKKIDDSLPSTDIAPSTKLAPQSPDVAVPVPKQLAREQSGVSLPDNTTKLNTARLNTSDEGKAVLDHETQATIDRLGNKEVQDYAAKAGIDTRTHTTEQTREIIAKQLNVRQDAVKYLAQAKEATDPNVKADLIRRAAERGRTSREQGTDIARQLQARKIIANELDTPEQRIFKLLDNAGVNPDVYSRRLAEVDFADSKQVIAAYRDLVPAKAKDWLDTLRYNSMLSSPLTQAVNTFGNAQNILVAGVEKNLRGNIDAIGGLFGRPRQYARGEGSAYVRGSAGAIQEASHNFVDALRGTGKYANSDLEEYSIPLATKGAAGAAFRTLSAPMRVLDGMDKFFRTMAEAGEEASLVRRESKGIQIKGNRDAIKKAEADYRVFQTDIGTPGQGIVNDAFDQFAGIVMKARSSKNPLICIPAKFTVPFVKTVNNIGKQGIVDYSPLGLVNLKGNADKTTAITRAVMGSAVFGSSAALLAQGQMTWAEPRNADERARFRAEGKQPYAVRIGDKWVNFSKLTPSVAFPMAMTAALHDALENKKTDQGTVDAVLEAVSKYGNFLSDQSYAKSIGDTLGAIGGDKEAIAQAVSNNVQQVVPFRALSGWVARISDNTERKVNTDQGYIAQQVESLMQQIPGLRQNTTTRDADGIPIAANNQVFNGFSPVRVTNDRSGTGFNAGGAQVASSSPSRSKTDSDSTIKAAFNTPEGRKFIALKDADKKAAAQSDPEARALYDQYQAMKKGLSTSTDLRAADLSPQSTKTLNKYDRLTTSGRDKLFERQPDAEFQYSLSKYENDLKSGKLSQAENIKKQQELKKSLVGSKFDKSTRDLYGLSKAQLADLVDTQPELAAKLKEYDNALLKAGLISTAKFKNGFKSGSRGSKLDYAARFAATNKSMAANQTALRNLVGKSRISGGKSSGSAVKGVSLKRKKTAISKVGRKA